MNKIGTCIFQTDREICNFQHTALFSKGYLVVTLQCMLYLQYWYMPLLIKFFFLLKQNFTLTKDELGVTGVQDLSPQDMDKVRSLSLIELTALFDSHGLALHRRKPIKRRVRGKVALIMVLSNFREI